MVEREVCLGALCEILLERNHNSTIAISVTLDDMKALLFYVLKHYCYYFTRIKLMLLLAGYLSG